MAPVTWIRVLIYAVGTVILVAVVFSLAQVVLARLYGEKLETGEEAEAPDAATGDRRPGSEEPAGGRRR